MRNTHPLNSRATALAILMVCLAAIFAVGCGENFTKLSAIMNNPDAYRNKDVQVAGRVTQVYELPMGITDIAAYRINDNTGQIWIISRAGSPVVGDKLAIKGTVKQMARLKVRGLGNILGDVIDEHERRSK